MTWNEFWEWFNSVFFPENKPPEPEVKRWDENLSIIGVDPALEVTATMYHDDGTVVTAVRDTGVTDMHRMIFHMESPPNTPGWGVHIDLTVPQGYVGQDHLRYTLGGPDGGHELEPSISIAAEPPPQPTFPKRTGVVVANGKASQDMQGLWHPLGTTFFWAMQGWKTERDRMKQNAVYLKAKGFDYVRILGLVAWENREIDPSQPQWSDYNQVLGETIDFLYDECGMRVELTIDGKGTSCDLNDIARRCGDVVANGRVEKIVNWEMANEYDVGRGPSIEQMFSMARHVRARVPNLLALSSPGSWESLEEAVRDPVNAFTVHIDRGSSDAKWRQVRQGYDFKNVKCWVSGNEPPGPASSVATNDNPLQLAMMRAVGVMCGGSAYVLHTGTGVFGNGVPHPSAGARPPNFWEIENFEAICSAVRNIDPLLPEGVENWRVANTQWRPPNPVAPFQPHEHWEGLRGSGVNKAYSALCDDGRVIQMPCGVLHHVEMTASYDMHEVTVYDPLTLQPWSGCVNRSFRQGEKMDLPGSPDSMVAYIIHGRR